MTAQLGVVAAGHPVTAAAGAEILRAGGNAVDAAICAVLTSFAAESPLTGIGAGGFMLIHTPEGEDHLLDFFVQAPAAVAPGGAQEPIEVDFEGAVQTFHCGPASCGVYGTLMGLHDAHRRFGSLPLGELAAPAVRAAREGVETTAMHDFLYRILAPILTRWPECRAIYAAAGRVPARGDRLRLPELGDSLLMFAEEGWTPFYRGDVAARVSEFVLERGGTITRDDLAAYSVIDRRPGRVAYRGHTVVTNPPPSSGGVLVALSLRRLAELASTRRDGTAAVGPAEIVAALGSANAARTAEFARRLGEHGFFETCLRSDLASGGEALGSTTHISVIDAAGMAVSCTCSNGSGSGVAVPGTGIILNNMLGELDLNPLGLGSATPGERVSSMMAPTIVLDGADAEWAVVDGPVAHGEPVMVLGSAGSNRIRSAILQVISNVVDRGTSIPSAVTAPRVHFEDGVVQAEPGVDPDVLAALRAAGVPVVAWERPNLFFGGCQVAGRDRATGALIGAGDPRRGGAVEIV